MFAKLLKSKPLLIYLIGGLCVFIGVYFGYQYYVNTVVKIEKMTDSATISTNDDGDESTDDSNQLDEPAYKKNKIGSSILPFAAKSSVGPPTSGVAFNSEDDSPEDDLSKDGVEGMQEGNKKGNKKGNSQPTKFNF